MDEEVTTSLAAELRLWMSEVECKWEALLYHIRHEGIGTPEIMDALDDIRNTTEEINEKLTHSGLLTNDPVDWLEELT